MMQLDTILLYIIIILFAISLLFKLNAKRCAKKMLKQQKAIYSGNMEYVQANPQDFPWTDDSFYDDVYNKLTAEGFRHVGNIESLTATRQFPGMRTYLMCFLGDGGTVTAAAYHVKVQGFMKLLTFVGFIPKNMYTCDFESEFTDSTFLCTNNCEGLIAKTDYPGITAILYPPDTPAEELLSIHRENLKDAVELFDLQPLSFATIQELLASQERSDQIKSAHKKKTGYVTRAEMEELTGSELKEGEEKLFMEFQKEVDKDKKREEKRSKLNY